MKNKRNLLFITKSPLGYHTDTFEYCRYIRDDYNISYLCWDYGKDRIELDGVKVYYIPRKGNKIVRIVKFIIACINFSKSYEGLIFIKYFEGCSFIRLFNLNKSIICDVRTGSVNDFFFLRMCCNYLMKIEYHMFNHRTVISESLAKKLKLKKSHILPLGANVISNSNKSFNDINLLYVGTFTHRNIEETIIGYIKFYNEYKKILNLSYTVVGSGTVEDTNRILSAINNTEANINLVGRIPYVELKTYLNKSNVGVSYIPKTDYFDCQPPTKTFEYLLSGMPVIATSTYENSLVIVNENGVLIEDNPDDFYNGLCTLFESRLDYNSILIKKSVGANIWKNIIDLNLKKYLEII